MCMCVHVRPCASMCVHVVCICALCGFWWVSPLPPLRGSRSAYGSTVPNPRLRPVLSSVQVVSVRAVALN